MSDAIWTRKNGTQIAVKDMATDHIRNALAMLKRKGAVSPNTQKFYLGCPGPVGEAAQDAFDAEFAEVMSRSTSEFIDIFEAELKEREGIPADVTRVVDISKVRGAQPSAFAKVMMPMADGLREQGYKWFRVTAPSDDEAHVYLEAWRERPEINGVLREGMLDRSKAEAFTP